MAKRKKKTTTKRKTYKVYGSKKGMTRRTARKAYMPVRAKRRAARRNPKGIMASPAIKYSLATAAGFAAASYADTWDMLNPVDDAGKSKIPFGLKGSALASVITFLVAQYALKGQNKQYARAAAVGMIAPTAINMAKEAMTPSNGNGNGGALHNLPARQRVHRLAANKGSATNFANASRSLDSVPA